MHFGVIWSLLFQGFWVCCRPFTLAHFDKMLIIQVAFYCSFSMFWNNFLPANKTPWQGRNDVSLYVPATSQVRLKWNIKWRLDGTSPRSLSGTFPRRLTTSQEDETTTSHQYVSTTSQRSLKWNTQRRFSCMSARRLRGTYPRRPISTSLRCLL